MNAEIVERQLPTPPDNPESLLDLYRQLKQLLISYVRRTYRREIRSFSEARLKKSDFTDDELTQTAELLLFDLSPVATKEIIDGFLQYSTELWPAHRKLVKRWNDHIYTIFCIESVSKGYMTAHNLVDDLSYVLVFLHTEQTGNSFVPGAYFVSRILPLYEWWLLSGNQIVLRTISELDAYGMAAEIATKNPALFFRNPEHLTQGWRQLQNRCERFQQLFGAPWITGSPTEILDAYKRLLAAPVVKQGNVALEELKEFSERMVERAELPAELMASENLGMICLPKDGIRFIPRFNVFLGFVEQPEQARDAQNKALINEMLRSDSISPDVIVFFAEQHKDKVNELLRIALDRPDFEWDRDGEATLRELKPSYYSKPRLPPDLPMSTKMTMGFIHYRQRQQEEQERKAAGRSPHRHVQRQRKK